MFRIYKYFINTFFFIFILFFGQQTHEKKTPFFFRGGIRPIPLNHIIKRANMIPIVKIITEEDMVSLHYLNMYLKCSDFWMSEL